MNTASAPNSTALLITTSMSNSRYRRIETPIASGINVNDGITMFWRTVIQPGWSSPPQEYGIDTIIAPA